MSSSENEFLFHLITFPYLPFHIPSYTEMLNIILFFIWEFIWKNILVK